MQLRGTDLYGILRRMKEEQETFYYDGESVAIRLINVHEPVVPMRIAERVFVHVRECETAHAGVQFVWPGAVSPNVEENDSEIFCVVTLEGYCPRTMEEFDREYLEPSNAQRDA